MYPFIFLGASKIKRLKSSIDSGCFVIPLLPEYLDVHVIANTLKLYLRELPDPLLTNALFDDWMNSMKGSEEQKLQTVKNLLKKLPTANRENLAYLMQFLGKLSKQPENKMSSSNIAICIAPNLLWDSSGSKDDANGHMLLCSIVNLIVEFFINNVEVLFPEDVQQYSKFKSEDLIKDKQPVNMKYHDNDNDNMPLDGSSPKPHMRIKKKPAPEPPPHNKQEHEFNNVSLTASYPSGSTTLNRPHKNSNPKVKASVGVKTDEVSYNSLRRKSLIEAGDNMHKTVDLPKAVLVNSNDTKPADYKCVDVQSPLNVQISRAKPVQQVIAQNVEKPVINNSLQKSANPHFTETLVRPVAAPRSFDNEKATLRIENPLTKSLTSVDADLEFVQIRKPLIKDESMERPAKPVIPARPASLRALPRSSVDSSDSMVQRTQCSVYSVAHKQQPSIVNLQNREKLPAGHDLQMAEKEKFLGHQPERVPAPRISLENKFNDINCNCDNQSNTISSCVAATLSNNKSISNTVMTCNTTLPNIPDIMSSPGMVISTATNITEGNSSAVEISHPVMALGDIAALPALVPSPPVMASSNIIVSPTTVPSPSAAISSTIAVSSTSLSNSPTVRLRTSSIGNKPEVPSKPPCMKSNEKLNIEHQEKFNGNNTKPPSHLRTRSDGNLIDLNPDAPLSSNLHTPSSPRALNKPTEPPPPPPVVHKLRSDSDSTNL